MSGRPTNSRLLRKPRWLHDARHTAATMLLVLGVPTRAVMEVMGWSQMSMTTRYQHITAELVAGIVQQAEDLLWTPGKAPQRTTETGTETAAGTDDLGARLSCWSGWWARQCAGSGHRNGVSRVIGIGLSRVIGMATWPNR